MNLTELRELLTFLTFVFGAFKSTPEGRKRRAAIRLHKAKEQWRKDRYKFLNRLRKFRDKNKITAEKYEQELNDWDLHNPHPE